MKIPKPLTKDQFDTRDALRVMAGWEKCRYCKGSGNGYAYERTVDGLKGKVYHSVLPCPWCKGERYVTKKNEEDFLQ